MPAFGTKLPAGTTLAFVLDDPISSSKTRPGTRIRMHLRDALILSGRTVAAAGSPAGLAIVTTSKAQTGDVDGAVQIYLEPFSLPGRDLKLPLRAYHEYLTVDRTAGELSTRSATDQVADVFVPYHILYHMFRPGRQLMLPAGSILRAEADATLDASDPDRLVIATPPPFVSNYDTPHADLTPAPLFTPAPTTPRPLPKGRSTLPPRPSPSATATPLESSSAAPTPDDASASPASPSVSPSQ